MIKFLSSNDSSYINGVNIKIDGGQSNMNYEDYTKEKNLLSIVIHGRNDDYNPHFLSRLEYSLEYASYCLNNLKIKTF